MTTFTKYLERKLSVPTTFTKAVSTVISFLLAAYTKIPSNITGIATLTAVLFAFDTIMGMWYAVVSREISSRKMAERIFTKFLQYTSVIVCGAAVKYIANDWWILFGAFMAVMSVEIISIMEKAGKLQLYGGVDFKYFAPFVASMSKYFASTAGVQERLEEQARKEGGERQ